MFKGQRQGCAQLPGAIYCGHVCHRKPFGRITGEPHGKRGSRALSVVSMSSPSRRLCDPDRVDG